MFEQGLENAFSGMFGKVAPGMCRLTMTGNIAVKTGSGYVSYDVKKNRLTNVTHFSFNIGDEVFFVIPTKKVEVGDIILVNGKPKCVTAAGKNEIEVVDYENKEKRTIIPERHVFMGKTYFYGKIVSMFGDSFGDKKGGIKNMMKMMMIGQMLNNNKSSDGYQNNGGGIVGSMGQMMMMSMFMGGKNNPFEGMFDFSFDDDDEDEEETTGIDVAEEDE